MAKRPGGRPLADKHSRQNTGAEKWRKERPLMKRVEHSDSGGGSWDSRILSHYPEMIWGWTVQRRQETQPQLKWGLTNGTWSSQLPSNTRGSQGSIPSEGSIQWPQRRDFCLFYLEPPREAGLLPKWKEICHLTSPALLLNMKRHRTSDIWKKASGIKKKKDKDKWGWGGCFIIKRNNVGNRRPKEFSKMNR